MGLPVLNALPQDSVCWAPAQFYAKEGALLRCTLCPHACMLQDCEVGACHVRRRNGEQLETATFSSTVRHLDPVERKPFYHWHPGTKVLTLASPGCTFSCSYCLNYRLSQYGQIPTVRWQGALVDPHELVAAAVAHRSSIGFSYSEPGLAAELTLAIAQLAKPAGVGIVWKTNGYLTGDAVKTIAPHLAAVNLDIKASNERRHRAFTGAQLEPVLNSLKIFLERGVWVEVSTPVIPNFNSDGESLRQIAGMLTGTGLQVPWHLVRFVPEFRMRNARPTHPDELAQAVLIARSEGVDYVYVERALGPSARNTYCPSCRAEVVSRDIWATGRVSLKGGQCPQCLVPVPGRW